MRRLHLIIATCLGFALALSSGCVAVKPWDREMLARPDMAWDPDPLQSRL